MSIKTIHTFHRLGQLSDATFEKEMEKLGCTARQAVVLTAIDETPGGNQTSLVQSTHIDRSTLSDIVQRLERGGLVKRKRGTGKHGKSPSDARAFTVTLTNEGQRTAKAIYKVAGDVAEQLVTAAREMGVTFRV